MNDHVPCQSTFRRVSIADEGDSTYSAAFTQGLTFFVYTNRGVPIDKVSFPDSSVRFPDQDDVADTQVTVQAFILGERILHGFETCESDDLGRVSVLLTDKGIVRCMQQLLGTSEGLKAITNGVSH